MRVPWPAVGAAIALASVLLSRLLRWGRAMARYRGARDQAAALREQIAGCCEKVEVRSAHPERVPLGSVSAERSAPVAAGAALVLAAPVLLDDVRGRRLRLPEGSSLVLAVGGDGVAVEARVAEPWLFDFYLRPDRQFWLLARRPDRASDGVLDVAPAPSPPHFVPSLYLSDSEASPLFETPVPDRPPLAITRPLQAALLIAATSSLSSAAATAALAVFVVIFGAGELIDWSA